MSLKLLQKIVSRRIRFRNLRTDGLKCLTLEKCKEHRTQSLSPSGRRSFGTFARPPGEVDGFRSRSKGKTLSRNKSEPTLKKPTKPNAERQNNARSLSEQERYESRAMRMSSSNLKPHATKLTVPPGKPKSAAKPDFSKNLNLRELKKGNIEPKQDKSKPFGGIAAFESKQNARDRYLKVPDQNLQNILKTKGSIKKVSVKKPLKSMSRISHADKQRDSNIPNMLNVATLVDKGAISKTRSSTARDNLFKKTEIKGTFNMDFIKSKQAQANDESLKAKRGKLTVKKGGIQPEFKKQKPLSDTALKSAKYNLAPSFFQPASKKGFDKIMKNVPDIVEKLKVHTKKPRKFASTSRIEMCQDFYVPKLKPVVLDAAPTTSDTKESADNKRKVSRIVKVKSAPKEKVDVQEESVKPIITSVKVVPVPDAQIVEEAVPILRVMKLDPKLESAEIPIPVVQRDCKETATFSDTYANNMQPGFENSKSFLSRLRKYVDDPNPLEGTVPKAGAENIRILHCFGMANKIPEENDILSPRQCHLTRQKRTIASRNGRSGSRERFSQRSGIMSADYDIHDEPDAKRKRYSTGIINNVELLQHKGRDSKTNYREQNQMNTICSGYDKVNIQRSFHKPTSPIAKERIQNRPIIAPPTGSTTPPHSKINAQGETQQLKNSSKCVEKVKTEPPPKPHLQLNNKDKDVENRQQESLLQFLKQVEPKLGFNLNVETVDKVVYSEIPQPKRDLKEVDDSEPKTELRAAASQPEESNLRPNSGQHEQDLKEAAVSEIKSELKAAAPQNESTDSNLRPNSRQPILNLKEVLFCPEFAASKSKPELKPRPEPAGSNLQPKQDLKEAAKSEPKSKLKAASPQPEFAESKLRPILNLKEVPFCPEFTVSVSKPELKPRPERAGSNLQPKQGLKEAAESEPKSELKAAASQPESAESNLLPKSGRSKQDLKEAADSKPELELKVAAPRPESADSKLRPKSGRPKQDLKAAPERPQSAGSTASRKRAWSKTELKVADSKKLKPKMESKVAPKRQISADSIEHRNRMWSKRDLKEAPPRKFTNYMPKEKLEQPAVRPESAGAKMRCKPSWPKLNLKEAPFCSESPVSESKQGLKPRPESADSKVRPKNSWPRQKGATSPITVNPLLKIRAEKKTENVETTPTTSQTSESAYTTEYTVCMRPPSPPFAGYLGTKNLLYHIEYENKNEHVETPTSTTKYDNIIPKSLKLHRSKEFIPTPVGQKLSKTALKLQPEVKVESANYKQCATRTNLVMKDVSKAGKKLTSAPPPLPPLKEPTNIPIYEKKDPEPVVKVADPTKAEIISDPLIKDEVKEPTVAATIACGNWLSDHEKRLDRFSEEKKRKDEKCGRYDGVLEPCCFDKPLSGSFDPKKVVCKQKYDCKMIETEMDRPPNITSVPPPTLAKRLASNKRIRICENARQSSKKKDTPPARATLVVKFGPEASFKASTSGKSIKAVNPCTRNNPVAAPWQPVSIKGDEKVFKKELEKSSSKTSQQTRNTHKKAPAVPTPSKPPTSDKKNPPKVPEPQMGFLEGARELYKIIVSAIMSSNKKTKAIKSAPILKKKTIPVKSTIKPSASTKGVLLNPHKSDGIKFEPTTHDPPSKIGTPSKAKGSPIFLIKEDKKSAKTSKSTTSIKDAKKSTKSKADNIKKIKSTPSMKAQKKDTESIVKDAKKRTESEDKLKIKPSVKAAEKTTKPKEKESFKTDKSSPSVKADEKVAKSKEEKSLKMDKSSPQKDVKTAKDTAEKIPEKKASSASLKGAKKPADKGAKKGPESKAAKSDSKGKKTDSKAGKSTCKSCAEKIEEIFKKMDSPKVIRAKPPTNTRKYCQVHNAVKSEPNVFEKKSKSGEKKATSSPDLNEEESKPTKVSIKKVDTHKDLSKKVLAYFDKKDGKKAGTAAPCGGQGEKKETKVVPPPKKEKVISAASSPVPKPRQQPATLKCEKPDSSFISSSISDGTLKPVGIPIKCKQPDGTLKPVALTSDCMDNKMDGSLKAVRLFFACPKDVSKKKKPKATNLEKVASKKQPFGPNLKRIYDNNEKSEKR